MKITAIGIMVLVLLTLAVIINSLALDYNISAILTKITNAEESYSLADEYLSIYEDFMRREKFIAITVSHGDLTEIESCFAELLGAAKAKDDVSLIIAKSRLEKSLLHLKRLCGISPEGIF